MSKIKKSVRNIFRTSIIILMTAFLPLEIYSASDDDSLLKDINNTFCVDTMKNNEESEKVYITKSGKCYHKSDCDCLKKSKIEISKDQAENYHYLECSKCFG